MSPRKRLPYALNKYRKDALAEIEHIKAVLEEITPSKLDEVREALYVDNPELALAILSELERLHESLSKTTDVARLLLEAIPVRFKEMEKDGELEED